MEKSVRSYSQKFKFSHRDLICSFWTTSGQCKHFVQLTPIKSYGVEKCKCTCCPRCYIGTDNNHTKILSSNAPTVSKAIRCFKQSINCTQAGIYTSGVSSRHKLEGRVVARAQGEHSLWLSDPEEWYAWPKFLAGGFLRVILGNLTSECPHHECYAGFP